MQSKWNDEHKFVKKHVSAVGGVLDLIRDRRLELRDAAVLMALEHYCSWRSGRIRVTARKLAERLGMQEKHVISSLSRLRKLELLVKSEDEGTGEWYYLLTPELLTVGTKQTGGLLWSRFLDALPSRTERTQGDAGEGSTTG